MNDLDLVEQYFLRELTEAEEQALDEPLESSPEAAELFEQKAKSAYLRYGLPDPQLPPQAPSGGGSTALFKWLWVLAGYGLLTGAFWFWSRNHDFHWPWDSSEPVLLSTPALPPAPKGLKTAPHAGLDQASPSSPLVPSTDDGGTDPDLALAMGVQPTPEEEAAAEVTPEPVNPLSPSNPAPDNPGHPGLRVIVDRPLPGLVTVTVLDTTGKEIRMLYAGVLKSGRWAFEWDGRLADGSHVPIGSYTIQVKSGSTVQTQEVWVDK